MAGSPLEVVWDMETSDPDDFLTLLLLLGHPRVRLKAVTLTPGTPEQVGLVRRALSWFERDIPVGAFNLDHPKQCVSAWHHATYGAIAPSRDALPGAEVLSAACDERTTLITGAPLKNVGAAMRASAAGAPFRAARLVAQGGFAGANLVPAERQLEKFKGLMTCPSFNLNGDPRAALEAQRFPGFGIRRFVSKNVCHGVAYDAALHEHVGALREKSRSLALLWEGMDSYLRRRPEGKLLHDPLAACCAIDESIGTWAEVEIYRERGEWGARATPGSGTWIIVDYDHERFVSVLTEY